MVFEFSLKILATTADFLLLILDMKILRAFVTWVYLFKESSHVIRFSIFFNLLENVINTSLGAHNIAS